VAGNVEVGTEARRSINTISGECHGLTMKRCNRTVPSRFGTQSAATTPGEWS